MSVDVTATIKHELPETINRKAFQVQIVLFMFPSNLAFAFYSVNFQAVCTVPSEVTTMLKRRL